MSPTKGEIEAALATADRQAGSKIMLPGERAAVVLAAALRDAQQLANAGSAAIAWRTECMRRFYHGGDQQKEQELFAAFCKTYDAAIAARAGKGVAP